MRAVPFNTYKFFKRLKDSGVSEAQAEAFGAAVCDLYETAELATKTDLERLEVKVSHEIDNVRHEVDGLRKEMHQEIGGLRKEVHQEISGLRKEMKSMGLRLTILLGGIVFAIVNAGPFLPKLLHWF